MLDFLIVSTRSPRKNVVEIYPKFIIKKSRDLMIRGKSFYAIWNEDAKLWSTDEETAINLIDKELDIFAAEKKDAYSDSIVKVMHAWDADTGTIDKWNKYCQKQMPEHYHNLDEKVIFANSDTSREDYATKKLSYPIQKGEMRGYETIMSTLYSPEERKKLEWAIGSIIVGDSKYLQKFIVLYGSAGTGKSTVLNIIQKIFDGYYCTFDAKALGSSNDAFALEAFRTNPLVAIQHDGDLSRIEDNTRLNSLVSHEEMVVNEKFKAAYSSRFKSFLFMGTNRPVRITDAKSGLLRRLIDVFPSGKKLSLKDYNSAMRQIDFELGAIAEHCRSVYLSDKDAYENYVPSRMIGASNDFYNFVMDAEIYPILSSTDGITLRSAWDLYKHYCEDAKLSYPYTKMRFKEELKNYFRNFKERAVLDGVTVVNYYSDFKITLNTMSVVDAQENYTIDLGFMASVFDRLYADCQAQYADKDGKPMFKWENVRTKLKDLDTHKVHYVKFPENLNHIVIDFDLKDSDGQKNLDLNIEAARKFPPTYTEVSKGGAGLHLHYIYEGDTSVLSSVYAENIEIKIFKGGASLRRRLSQCNNLPVATINSGLPLKKKGAKMVTSEKIKSERGIRSMIAACLNKQHHGATKPECDFIFKILEDAYEDGLDYDVSDMRNDILAFGAASSHNADYCIKLIGKMRFKSAEKAENTEASHDTPIIFFDCEVFPNLFLINYKLAGKDQPVVRMINPKPHEVENLFRFRAIGFNNRGYDNHICYARIMGYTNEMIFDLSQRLVSKDASISKKAKFGDAYNLSYTDILDFSSERKSLKKWEIEMGIHHMELGLPWDKPVPEEKWIEVAEYCDNDVLATEALFNYGPIKTDWKTRQILADLAGMTVNDSTNSLITKIVFGDDKNPQSRFNYRNMGDKPSGEYFTWKDAMSYAKKDTTDLPSGQVWFEGYKFWIDEQGPHSTYRDVADVGEGGYVYSEPGIYYHIKTQDVSGQHPSSIRAENLFGPYTDTYNQIVDSRIAIKHGDFDSARKMLDGKLAKYLDDESEAKGLGKALKLVVNRVYGQTFTPYPNAFKDPRNIDNIVAKRGSLFMIDLRNAVESLGWHVVHCKTDSIKIANITDELIEFIRRFGECYGYRFETEEEYNRFCLVNKAVYIAKTERGEWTATGTEFQIPYVFKKLFTHEEIEFEDLCEVKSVKHGAIYLDMNENLPDVSEIELQLRDLQSIKNDICKEADRFGDFKFNRDEKLAKKISRYNKKYNKNSNEPINVNDILDTLKADAAKGHNYQFVGRVGQFTPIKPGRGGGEMLRLGDGGKYYAVTGTSGFRWLESALVKALHKEDDIDISYYEIMAEEAQKDIMLYGDFDSFVNNEETPEVEFGFNGAPIYKDALPFD